MKRWTTWLGAIAAAALIGGCGGWGSDAPPTAARVVIEQSGLLLTGIGASAQLQASARDANDARLADAITWSSNRPGVVQVDAAGHVVAQAAVGSAQIVAHAGAVSSAPLLVVVAVPAAGVRVLSDEEIAGDPVEVNPAAPPSRDNTYQITLATAVELPTLGARMLGTGSKPLAGEVVAVDAAARKVTLRPVPPRQLLPGMRVNEVIDLAQADLSVPADIAARYEVRRNGASFDYVPRPGGLQTGRAHALAAVGTRALPPFGSCETTVTGLGADAPLPIGLSAPPLFTVSLPTTIEYIDTPENGVERLVLKGETSAKAEFGLGVAAAFEGKFECKAELGTITIPIGGFLAWVAGGQIPYGIGFELGGKLTVANFGIGGKAEVSGPVELGFACVSPTGCGFVRNLDLTPKNEWTTNAPSLGDLRVDVGLSAFGFAKANFGSRIFRSLQVEGFTAKFGGKLTGSFAPQVTQIIDTSYQSDYKLSLEASAGIGQDLDGILKLLGVSSVSALELSVSRDIGRSPSGTLSADRSSFTVGDRVNFKATLANLEFIAGVGPYNVDKVLLVRDAAGARSVVGTVNASAGQREFDFAFDASGPGAATEFYAFAVTRMLPFEFASLELARATGPNVQVVVTPASAIVAPGASQVFAATVSGTTQTGVTWSASAGSITANGVFTAPNESSTVTITATSVADPSVSASGSVTVGVGLDQWIGTVTVESTYSFNTTRGTSGDMFTQSASHRATVNYQVTAVGVDGLHATILATSIASSGSFREFSQRETTFAESPTCNSITVSSSETLGSAAPTVTVVNPAASVGVLDIQPDGSYTLSPLPGSVATPGTVRARFSQSLIPVGAGGCGNLVPQPPGDVTTPAVALVAGGYPSPRPTGMVQGATISGSAIQVTENLIEPGDSSTVTITWNLTRR